MQVAVSPLSASGFGDTHGVLGIPACSLLLSPEGTGELRCRRPLLPLPQGRERARRKTLPWVPMWCAQYWDGPAHRLLFATPTRDVSAKPWSFAPIITTAPVALT
jgi:hypothetical protein